MPITSVYTDLVATGALLFPVAPGFLSDKELPPVHGFLEHAWAQRGLSRSGSVDTEYMETGHLHLTSLLLNMSWIVFNIPCEVMAMAYPECLR